MNAGSMNAENVAVPEKSPHMSPLTFAGFWRDVFTSIEK